MFRNDKFNGPGTMTYSDGSVYKGNFENNHRSGMGTATLADGSKYEGSWWEDKFDGRGQLTLATGDKKEGLWKAGSLAKKEDAPKEGKAAAPVKQEAVGSGWQY